MKKLLYILKYTLYSAVLLTGTALFFSCREKIGIINTSIKEDFPTQTATNFKTTYSDSSNLKLLIKAPLLKYYGKMEEPYTDFDKGIDVYFFEGYDKQKGHISAKYARYIESKRLWEVRDSVVAVNEKGDILETELLFWDEEKEEIYTDKFVKITQEDQIITGTGLISDPIFSKWRIKNVIATLYFENE